MFYEKPRRDYTSGAVSGDPATFGEIFDSTYESMKLVENANAKLVALERSYDARMDAVEKATGVRLLNPVRDMSGSESTMAGFEASAPNPHGDFQQRLNELAEQFPDASGVIAANRPVIEDARKMAAEAEGRSSNAWQRSAGGGAAWAARLAGGFAGGMMDPVNVFTLGVGPWGAASAGIRGVAMMALKQAAANAAVTAGVQPVVQGWRKESGLSYGVSEAALNTAFAFGLGFTVDAGVRSAVRGVRRLAGNPYTGPVEALGNAAANAPEGSVLRRASDGDPIAIRELAEATGLDADPAVRGGLAEMDIEAQFKAPDGVDDAEHLFNLSRAVRQASGEQITPVGDAIKRPDTPPRTDLSNDTRTALGSIETVEGRPVAFRGIPAKNIIADAATFQFKSDGDASGVTARLQGVTRWDPLAAGKAVVFERADGRLVIADGHQRLGLAKRLSDQNPQLHAYVFREADGWTPSDVRAYAAIKNMKELSGASLDMAKVMRERPDLIDGSLPLTDGKMREAVLLSRLSEPAFAAVVGGRLPPSFAALIGESAADASRHVGLIEEMAAADLANVTQARFYLAQLMELPTTTETQITLFGEEAFTRTVMLERSKVLDASLKTLKTDKRIFSLVEREARTIEGAGNQLDRQANAARAQNAAELAELIEKLATSRGIVATILNDAASAVSRGLKPGMAAKAFVGRVADILDKDGVQGLLRAAEDAPELAPVKMDDPMGPEAQAQVDGLTASQKAADDLADDMQQAMFALRGFYSPAEPRTPTEVKVYHGTRAVFDRFSPRKTGEVYFTNKPELADQFSGANDPLLRDGSPNTVPVFVEAKQFKTVDMDGYDWNADPSKLRAEIDKAKAEGHSGLIAKNIEDAGVIADQYITWTPETVRSAISDQQLFALSPALSRSTLSPAAAENMAAIRADIDTAVAKALPPGWRAEVRDNLVFGDLSPRMVRENPTISRSLPIEGTIDPYERIIYVSLAALDPREIAFEEIGHALKMSRLIPDADYSVLLAKAAEIDARKMFDIDARYKPVYGPRYRGDEVALEAALNEEAVMQMVAARARGTSFDAPSNRILDRLLNFLREVARALGLRGLRTVEDVFQDMTAGVFAGASEMRGAPAAALASGARGTRAEALAMEMGQISQRLRETDGVDLAAFREARQRFLEITEDPSYRDAIAILENETDRPGILSNNAYGREPELNRESRYGPPRGAQPASQAELDAAARSIAEDQQRYFEEQRRIGSPSESARPRPGGILSDSRYSLSKSRSDGPGRQTKGGSSATTPKIKQYEMGGEDLKEVTDFVAMIEANPVTRHGEYDIHRSAGMYGPVRYEVVKAGETPKRFNDDGEFESNVIAEGSVRLMGGPHMSPSEVVPEYRGQGIGALLYDAVDADLAKIERRLFPDSFISEAAIRFWEKRRPDALRHHERMVDGGAFRTGEILFALPKDAKGAIPDLINAAAAKGEITREDATRLIERYNALEKHYKSAPKAGEELAKELDAEAQHKKRQQVLQRDAQERVTRALISFRDSRGQADPAKAMIAMMENLGQHELPQGTDAVVSRRNAIIGLAMADLDQLADQFRKKLITGTRQNRARMDNVTRELFGQGTGDPEAAVMARAGREVMERLRQRFNAAGGAIGRRQDWGLPQWHDPAALINAGPDRWIEFIMPRLDPSRMVNHLTGSPMTPADLRQSLEWVYREITSDGWHERQATMQRRGIGSVANQRGDHRFLVFRDADAWMQYAREFGNGGDAFAVIVNHIKGMAEDIGAMEVFGPNPRATVEFMQQFVEQQAALRAANLPAHFPVVTEITGRAFSARAEDGVGIVQRRDPRAYAARMNQRLENMWNLYRGHASAPVGDFGAEASQAVRNVNVLTKLGGAAVSASGDLFWQVVARKFAGLPASRLIGDVAAQIAQGGEQEARRAGVIAESYLNMHNEAAREAASLNATRLTNIVADRVLAVSGLNAITRAGNHAMNMGIQAHLADLASLPFDRLAPEVQRLFRRYGMDAAEWDAIRMDASGNPRQADFLRPTDVEEAMAALGRDGERIAERYLGMLLQESQYATLTGTLRGRAIMLGSTKSGTLQGEFIRHAMQFKAFAVNIAILQLERMAREFVQRGAVRGAQYASFALISAVLGGALIEQMQQLRNGKDPRDMNKLEFWFTALYRSGGLSIWGDFLYAEQSRFGGGIAQTIAGPTAATVTDVARLTYGSARKSFLGEKTNFGREVTNFTRRYTPGASIWYLRSAWDRVLMDNLQRQLDPEAHAAFRRKIMDTRREYKQEFYWAPGQTAPARGPRLNQALGN